MARATDPELHAARRARLRERLAAAGARAGLFQRATDVGYLTGFTGSTAALLLTPEAAVFVTDSRYAVQAREECPGVETAIIQGSDGYPQAIAREAERLRVARLAVEAEYVTLARFEELRAKLSAVELVPLTELVGALRRVKDSVEIQRIRAACALADRGFEHLLSMARPGVTERELAVELERFLKTEGAEAEAFETIVASGPRSALPHGRASDRRLGAGELLLFDFGARLDGYNSDITRTVALGPADARQEEIHRVVLEARAAALAAIRPGVEGREVDAAAREVIAAAGYGECFGHGLGHGLGREVHDHLAFSRTSRVVLEPGMVVTVEPGIYLEGWGGVRVEDDVLVTAGGAEVLTHAPRHLIELPV